MVTSISTLAMKCYHKKSFISSKIKSPRAPSNAAIFCPWFCSIWLVTKPLHIAAFCQAIIHALLSCFLTQTERRGLLITNNSKVVITNSFSYFSHNMLIVLPDEKNGLPALLHTLSKSKDHFNGLFEGGRYHRCQFNITMPKFKLGCGANGRIDLKKPLTSMGLQGVFEEGRADFSGITNKENLFISEIFHQAVIEVLFIYKLKLLILSLLVLKEHSNNSIGWIGRIVLKEVGLELPNMWVSNTYSSCRRFILKPLC